MSVVKGKALVKMDVIQVGEYEFTKQDIIGHGAFAMVYKGRKRKNPSQAVAVKVVTKKGLQKASEILVKEIKILRELTALHHTNLVAMHDCMDSTAYVYVVMELKSDPERFLLPDDWDCTFSGIGKHKS
ncbi:unnamed protein product [Pieris macdunnoughi]|uniref:Protein kinase domain-containing protein n=1 Tax=Pieris macdunnoughi TaxID=345717 RepID=A0A821WZQ0_9NEOP|nr:unnamed protein product [Pieris macdunnoughi]